MNITTIIIQLFVILFAITVHEAAHGWAAFKLGDPTAKVMGRITLNPIAHIDPIGTILLPVLLVIMRAPPFGWAKPVPVNPLNFRNPRRDNLLVSAAGPLSNFGVATACMIILLFLKTANPGVNSFLRSYLSGYTRLTAGFHPLEGLAIILFWAIFLNVFLAVFNLIPIPPLDGSGILMGVISEEAARKYDRIRPFGFIIVLALLYTGVLQIILRPIQILIMMMLF
jgi:Zn-dependent protease